MQQSDSRNNKRSYDNFNQCWNNATKKDLSTQQYKPNYEPWNPEQATIWNAKSDEDLESYYINTKNTLARLKKQQPKYRMLIRKKKAWRDGLAGLLTQRDPDYFKAKLNKSSTSECEPKIEQKSTHFEPSMSTEEIELNRMREQKRNYLLKSGQNFPLKKRVLDYQQKTTTKIGSPETPLRGNQFRVSTEEEEADIKGAEIEEEEWEEKAPSGP